MVKMRIAKISALAAALILCLSGSLWADSVSQSDVVAAFEVTNSTIGQNWKAFESSRVLQSEFLAATALDLAGMAQRGKGHKAAAEADFSAAIQDLKLVANGLTPSTSTAMPDASSLGLLACSGLLLFGAMKKRFSR
jgi:hypothetical protein